MLCLCLRLLRSTNAAIHAETNSNPPTATPTPIPAFAPVLSPEEPFDVDVELVAAAAAALLLRRSDEEAVDEEAPAVDDAPAVAVRTGQVSSVDWRRTTGPHAYA